MNGQPDKRRFFRRPLSIFSHPPAHEAREPVVLVNGLAEQAESWFANRAYWSRHFDVKVPELLVYDGDVLHDHPAAGGEITVDYLVGRLSNYLDHYVQNPPYNLVGSSLGAQIILTYAARNPEKVARLVLIGASGLSGEENLPIVEGVRRSRYDTLVESVFHSKRFATDSLVDAVATKLQDRRWKKGALRTLRGTVGHSVAGLLEQVPHPCLAIWGAEDEMISDVPGSIRAASRIPLSRQLLLPNCGHAPQIEKSRQVNQLVARFLDDRLKTIPKALHPARFLATS
ncbi:MAG: alpha/beta fold hydrolase [Rubrobacteraceae bacterium]